MSEGKIALVTGANRGIGREVSRQLLEQGWTVIMTGRNEQAIRKEADQLGALSMVLDVTDRASVDRVAQVVEAEFGRLDALVNNAGAIFEDYGPSVDVDPNAVRQTFEVNVMGPFNLLQALGPLVARSGGNIVNVSSGMGGLEEMGPQMPGYRVSKVSLNALTRIFSQELMGARVNSVCPGWVQTDMGGANATRDVASGASGVVWAATLGNGGPNGGFFRDGEPIPW